MAEDAVRRLEHVVDVVNPITVANSVDMVELGTINPGERHFAATGALTTGAP